MTSHARDAAERITDLAWPGTRSRDEWAVMRAEFERHVQTAIDAATAEAIKERDAAYDQLRYLWQTTGSCPCGARIESSKTHPHVGGCPTAKALKQ